MKARVGNKIVDVIPDDGMWLDQSDMTYYSTQELTFDTEPDWSSFRREAAKDILAGFAAKIGHPMTDYSEQSCKYAIQLADELIRQLKEK